MKQQILLISIILISVSGYSQNGMQNVEKLQKMDIDMFDNIKIDNLIYYKNPIGLEYNSLLDTTYIPVWYNAYCVANNIEYFNSDFDEILKYVDKKKGLDKSVLEMNNEKVKSLGGIKAALKGIESDFPYLRYLYVYSEVWFSETKTGDKFLIIQGLNSPDIYNSFNEISEDSETYSQKTDSTSLNVTAIYAFSIVNDTVKYIDQTDFFNTFEQGKYSITANLKDFKKIIRRNNHYHQSEMENGKRIFKTMEKTGNNFTVKKVSNKPE